MHVPLFGSATAVTKSGQFLNTLHFDNVFKYIRCNYTRYLNTFLNMYLITVFKYFRSVYK